MIRLEARSPILTGHIVGRANTDQVVLTTFVHYKKRGIAPAVWALISPIHRRVVAYLLGRAADHPKVPTTS